MQLSPLFLEIWSFETIHGLNFNTQRQKRHDVTNGVKGNFLIFLVCRVYEKHAILKDFRNASPAKMLIYCQNIIFQ